MNRNRLFILLRFAVALGLLIFLIVSVGIEEIINTFKAIKLIPCVVVSFCLIFLVILGALNSWIILRTLHVLPFSIFLKTYIYSWIAGLISPGQAGDASLIIFLKKYDIPLRRTGIAYTTDKVITLAVFFFIGWYGSYILIPELKGIWFPLITLILLSFFFIFILIKFFPFHIPFVIKFREKLNEILTEFYIIKTKWQILLLNILLTIVKWLVLSLCYFAAFLCFNQHVKFPEIGIIPILSTLVGYIPVSVGGIGTVELTATHLFSKVGVEQSAVLSAYLLLRVLQYLLAIIVLAILSMKGKTWEVFKKGK